MKTNPICNVCSVALNDENWCTSCQKKNHYICRECHTKQVRSWRKANPYKARASSLRQYRKEAGHSFDENKECSWFLGVHVAERVLSHVFKNVERMPNNNPGYDFICNRGKKIDVKSSCLRKGCSWVFNIQRNTIADYFLCLAFDNRKDLNPLHIWLIPGEKLSHVGGAGISPSTVDKWDEYKLDTEKISICCDILRVV